MHNKNFKKNEGPVGQLISFRDPDLEDSKNFGPRAIVSNSSNKIQSDPNIEMNESGQLSNSIGKMSNSNFRNN